jgi:oligoribonuclease NrnB/cAMP/cGMP phosphodiesterase (DHH superfamily)
MLTKKAASRIPPAKKTTAKKLAVVVQSDIGQQEATDRAQKAVERARKSMAKFKATGGGDKHWRLSPSAMEDLRYIKENSIRVRTEQKIIADLLRKERKRLEVERS